MVPGVMFARPTTRHRGLCGARALLIGLVALALGACAHAPPSRAADVCPRGDRPERVYAIGSSTVGALLGPMLKRMLKADGLAVRRWGLASSGLARPDFHDWPAEVPKIMAEHDPQIVVISLGDNDFQNVFHKKLGWIRFEDPRWREIYAERVDLMLEESAGEQKQRLVLVSGPYAFMDRRSYKYGPTVNEIMRERTEAFAAAGGRAVYLDVWALTTDAKGNPLAEADIDGSGRKVRIRSKDGIHLTAKAVEALLADPLAEMIRGCLAEPALVDAEAADEGVVLAEEEGEVGDDEAASGEAASGGGEEPEALGDVAPAERVDTAQPGSAGVEPAEKPAPPMPKGPPAPYVPRGRG